MTEGLESLERKLDEHGRKLDSINKTLERIAVQDEQIRKHDQEIQAIWRKYDDHLTPCITQLKTFQASCPRTSINERFNRLWWMVGTVGFVSIAIGISLLTVGVKIMGWA